MAKPTTAKTKVAKNEKTGKRAPNEKALRVDLQQKKTEFESRGWHISQDAAKDWQAQRPNFYIKNFPSLETLFKILENLESAESDGWTFTQGAAGFYTPSKNGTFYSAYNHITTALAVVANLGEEIEPPVKTDAGDLPLFLQEKVGELERKGWKFDLFEHEVSGISAEKHFKYDEKPTRIEGYKLSELHRLIERVAEHQSDMESLGVGKYADQGEAKQIENSSLEIGKRIEDLEKKGWKIREFPAGQWTGTKTFDDSPIPCTLAGYENIEILLWQIGNVERVGKLPFEWVFTPEQQTALREFSQMHELTTVYQTENKTLEVEYANKETKMLTAAFISPDGHLRFKRQKEFGATIPDSILEIDEYFRLFDPKFQKNEPDPAAVAGYIWRDGDPVPPVDMERYRKVTRNDRALNPNEPVISAEEEMSNHIHTALKMVETVREIAEELNSGITKSKDVGKRQKQISEIVGDLPNSLIYACNWFGDNSERFLRAELKRVGFEYDEENRLLNVLTNEELELQDATIAADLAKAEYERDKSNENLIKYGQAVDRMQQIKSSAYILNLAENRKSDPIVSLVPQWRKIKWSLLQEIAETNSCSHISDGKPIHKPFEFEGKLYVATGSTSSHMTGSTSAEAYEVVEESEFGGEIILYHQARSDRVGGFYNGVRCKYQGKQLILRGPKLNFILPFSFRKAEENGWKIEFKDSFWSAEKLFAGDQEPTKFWSVRTPEELFDLITTREGAELKPAESEKEPTTLELITQKQTLPTHVIESVQVALTTKESVKKADDLQHARRAVEAEIKRFEELKDAHKATLKRLEANIDTLVVDYESKTEWRDMKCPVVYNFQSGFAEIYHPITQEKIKERALTEAERGGALFIK